MSERKRNLYPFLEIRKDFTRQVTSWMNSSKLNRHLQVASGKSFKQMTAQAREEWQKGASSGAQGMGRG